MIAGKVSKQESDCDGHLLLLGGVIKRAVEDAKQARRRRTDNAAVEFAEDWLLRFVEGSRYERKILELSGLR